MSDGLYCVRSKAPNFNGVLVHAPRSMFDDGIPRLIVGSTEKLGAFLPDGDHYEHVLYEPETVPAEPTIDVDEYLRLSAERMQR